MIHGWIFISSKVFSAIDAGRSGFSNHFPGGICKNILECGEPYATVTGLIGLIIVNAGIKLGIAHQ